MGGSNQTEKSSQKVQALVEKLIHLELKDWLKFHWAKLQIQPRAVYTNKDKSNDIFKEKTQTNSTAQTLTTSLKNRKSPAKQNSYRSPICQPISKLNNSNLELNSNKYKCSSESKMDHLPSSSGWECLKMFPPKSSHRDSKQIQPSERTETEGPNSTKRKITPIYHNSISTCSLTPIQWNGPIMKNYIFWSARTPK